MKKIKERNKKYEVSVRETSNGYFEARLSIKLGREKTIRIQKGGKSVAQAVDSLLTELYKHIDQLHKDSIITVRIDDLVVARLSDSINNLRLSDPTIVEKVYRIINLVNTVNASVDNVIPFHTPPDNILQSISQQYVQPNVVATSPSDKDTVASNDKLYTIEESALMWKKYELQLCVQSDDNPRPLSQKTVDGYITLMNNRILPFFKAKRLLYIKQVKDTTIKELLKGLNGYHNKRNVHIVCTLLFRYLVKEKIIKDNPMKDVKKPVKPAKNKESNIVCIDPENYYDYIEAFEEEGTDAALLCDTILCTGVRPEEACGLRWTDLQMDKRNGTYMLIILNATKNVAIYDEDMNVIGHKKQDDGLKTDTSYRSVPVPLRLVNQLLQHKERQKQRFKNSVKMKRKGRKWSENEYIFLCRTYTPYVSDSLDDLLKKFVINMD